MVAATLRRGMTLAILPGLMVAAIVAGACGGGGDDDDGNGGGSQTPTTAATDTPAGPVAREETITIGEAAWHSGFTIEFGDATFKASEPDALGRQMFTLTIEATFTNNGPDQRRFTAPIVAVIDGSAQSLRQGTEIPNIPSGLSGDGILLYVVPQEFDFDETFLLIGEGGARQASVPLGPGAGELVTLEPGEAAVSGQISIELLDLEVVSASLRADMPIVYREAPNGKLALTLNLKATSRKSGNWSLNAPNFALVLPNGNAIGPDGATLGSLPGQTGGVITEGLYVRFLVDDPPTGTYALRFIPPSYWLESGESADPVELEFELD